MHACGALSETTTLRPRVSPPSPPPSSSHSPPFMVLIIAILNDGTIMTLSVDRVLPSNTPDSWDLAEIFAFAVAYGIYLAASTIAFFAAIVYTSFFEDKFGVEGYKDHNAPELHMIIYLQVAMISQALIFVTRSHGFFFMERPSWALLGAFAIAQLVSSIIAAYADWGFTAIRGVSGGWIGITWVVSVDLCLRVCVCVCLQGVLGASGSLLRACWSRRWRWWRWWRREPRG